MKKKFKLYGGLAHQAHFFDTALEKKPSDGLLEHVVLPPNPTKDILVFGAKYVESRENLNKAYFTNKELASAYDSIPLKALDLEHSIEEIVGSIYSGTYVDRDTNRVTTKEDLMKLDEKELDGLTIDVIVGGVVYIDRFPQLEGPVSEKRYAISMECWFDDFDIRLENGIVVSLEEAELLGWSTLVDSLLGSFNTQEEFDKAHRVKVILADKSEVPMSVYKQLKGIMFSGAGLVINPACPSCKILSTSYDENLKSECTDICKEGESSEASLKTQADELITINLTKLDRYMEQWRSSSEGKPLNHQVKDNIITITSSESEPDTNLENKEKSDETHLDPFPKDRDPMNTDKDPSVCVNYKYEIWLRNGEQEEQMRHWCVYANEKCPTAGDHSFHECHRWYNRDGDWIYDTRNFRDAGNPFAPLEYDPDESATTSASASLEYKHMSAMVDKFMAQVESLRLSDEIKSKKQRKK